MSEQTEAQPNGFYSSHLIWNLHWLVAQSKHIYFCTCDKFKAKSCGLIGHEMGTKFKIWFSKKESTEKSFCNMLIFEALIYSYIYIIVKLLLYGRGRYYRKESTATWSFFHFFINNIKCNIILQKLRNQRMIVSIYYELKDNLKTLNYTISNAVSVCFYYCSIHLPMPNTIYQLNGGVGSPEWNNSPQENSTITKVKLISVKL